MYAHILSMIVLTAPLAPALEEGRLRDLRFRGGVTPASDDIDNDIAFVGGPSGTLEVPGFDPGRRFSLALYESFGTIADPHGTVLLGVSFSYGKQSSDTDRFAGDGGLDADVLALDVHAGYALPLSRRIHLEVLGFLGGGGVRITDHNPVTLTDPVTGAAVGTANSSRSDGDGAYYEGGISGGAYYTFANGLQLGIDAGVLAFTANATIDYEDARQEFTYRGVGPFANASLGLRF